MLIDVLVFTVLFVSRSAPRAISGSLSDIKYVEKTKKSLEKYKTSILVCLTLRMCGERVCRVSQLTPPHTRVTP